MTLYTARDSGVALVANTVQTIVQVLASSGRPLRLIEVGVSFNGQSTTDAPVKVDLLRQTTAGGSYTGLTLVKENSTDPATASAGASHTFGSEPTAGDILRTWYVTPLGGLFVLQFPLGREIGIAGTERLGIRCLAPSAAVSVSAYLTFEE